MLDLAMRRRLPAREVAALKFKVPLWPVGPALAIAFMLFVIGVLGYRDDTRVALYVGAGWILLMSLAYQFGVKPKQAQLRSQMRME